MGTEQACDCFRRFLSTSQSLEARMASVKLDSIQRQEKLQPLINKGWSMVKDIREGFHHPRPGGSRPQEMHFRLEGSFCCVKVKVEDQKHICEGFVFLA